MNKGKPENSFNISKNQEFELITSAYRKTGIRDPTKTGKPPAGPYKTRKTGTPAGPYKTRKIGTLAVPYKNRKTGTRDPSGTLEKLENRNPIIIIIIIFYYHHFIFC